MGILRRPPGRPLGDRLTDTTARAPIPTVVLIGVLWGLNWPVVKFMLTELPPVTLRAVAFCMAAALLALIARARGERLKPAPGEMVPIAVTGLLVICGFNVITTIAQLLTETSRAAIIAYTMPAMTAGLATVFLKERLSHRTVLALVLGMAGLAVLATEDLAGLVADPLGPALMLIAALSWSLGNISLKARQWSMPPLALTVWFFVASAMMSLPLVLVFEPPLQQSWPSAPVLWALIYHALGPMVICYALWTGLVGRVPATVAAIATLLAPVVGVASSVVFLGDPLTWQKPLALVLVLASIGLTLIPARYRE